MAGDCVERFQLKGAVSFQKIRAKVRLARATERWGRMPFHDIQKSLDDRPTTVASFFDVSASDRHLRQCRKCGLAL
jgi:hypothetical protein